MSSEKKVFMNTCFWNLTFWQISIFLVLYKPWKESFCEHIFCAYFDPLYVMWFSQNKLNKKRAKNRPCGDSRCGHIFCAYFDPLYGRWFSQNKVNKKRAKNHPCVVVVGANAIFVLFLSPYLLGDLLKIKWIKNAQQIILVPWLGVRTDFFRAEILKKCSKSSKKSVFFCTHT